MIDGLGDVGIPELDSKTPLQVANTPWLDHLAEKGLNGLLDPVEPGLACGSDTAHMSIIGYDPRIYYEGRGAFESIGAGLDMMPGDIAFKCNFAHLDKESGIVKARKADSNFDGALGSILCKAIDNIKLPSFPNHTVTVKHAIEHRCGVRIRGPNLSSKITGTDPLKDNKPLVVCKPIDSHLHDPDAIMTSQLVNELSTEFFKFLTSHPINQKQGKKYNSLANCVLLRGCGSYPNIPHTIEQLHGLKSFLIAPTCIIAGIGLTLGMDLIHVEGATGDYDTNFHSKARALLEHITLPHYQFGFCHLKAVDEAGHDRDLQKKIYYLEKIDEMIGIVIQKLNENTTLDEYTVVVTGDHTTPVHYGDHSCEPVPFVITKLKYPDHYKDSVDTYDEVSAGQGALGRFCGSQVMKLAKDIM
ncbi:MAG: 2,3-bisphosphoglycerate-independent phosphoglycerate mutase-domain-containing protein [Benjaminiella poitrasii]|nr:MAG: 2,3-bisphosphoglycerate-independent phosphoglycerate mutase-domain-containing protein [Benjaminiella poitrasii]